MNTKPITLTGNQMTSVARKAERIANDRLDISLKVTQEHLKVIIDAINDILKGDPIGTIRQSPSRLGGGELAIRYQTDLGDPGWAYLDLRCGLEFRRDQRRDDILDWDIIYQPPEPS